MEVITEQTQQAKLKILPKPIDDYSDDEFMQFLDNYLRPARSKLTTKKPRGKRTAAAAKTTIQTLTDDSIA